MERISLRILWECHGGGGETLRPSDARSNSKCVKFVWNCLYARILVLFAVELHRRCFFFQKTIIVGFPIEIGPGAGHSKSPFCDRFWARPRGRRRARAGGRSCPRVARRQVSLRILCESLRGGGETPRPPDAPASSECVKFVWNYSYARILVLFAVELHRRCFFFQKPIIVGFPIENEPDECQ